MKTTQMRWILLGLLTAQAVFADLSDGLVAYYPFNGNANDLSGNGNHGTVYGATATSNRFGSPSAAYSFDGTTSYIRVPSSPSLQLVSDFSLCLWYKPNAWNSQTFGRILTKHRAGPNMDGTWVLGLYGLFGVLDFEATPFFDPYTAGRTSPPVGQWTFATFTYAKATREWRFYMNGQLDNSGTRDYTILETPNDLIIGAENHLSFNPPYYWFFAGDLDDIRIYNRALTPSEIQSLFLEPDPTKLNSPPVITSQPASQFANAGASVAFAVTAVGSPPLHFQWQKNGTDIPGATTENLALTSVRSTDNANYTVRVWNAQPSVTSASAHLAVLTEGANGNLVNRIVKLPCPIPGPDKDSLVMVVHGVETFYLANKLLHLDWGNINWVYDMADAIRDKLNSHWEVRALDWRIVSQLTEPATVAALGEAAGQNYGYDLAQMRDWKKVHLIGHSAGAALIQAIAEQFKARRSQTVIQETFLDPFQGWLHGRTESFGRNVDWADGYFAANITSPVTAGRLPNAHTVDVTWLDTANIQELKTYCFASGTAESTPMTIFDQAHVCSVQPYVNSSHSWPHEFYQATIVGNVPDAADYGFPLSIEMGNEARWTQLPRDNEPVTLRGASTYTRAPVPSQTGALEFFDHVPNGTSDSGVNILGGGATLFAPPMQPPQQIPIKSNQRASELAATPPIPNPAWLALGLTITNPVNFVQFDATFTDSNQAEGLLTVYWNTNLIGLLGQRGALLGLRTHRLSLPETLTEGIYTLSFRLDAFGSNSSAMVITNVMTGFTGLSGPVNLSVAPASSNTPPTVQLTAPSGFNYVIETSTNLLDWFPTALWVNTNGSMRFFDPAATNSPQRFYHVVLP